MHRRIAVVVVSLSAIIGGCATEETSSEAGSLSEKPTSSVPAAAAIPDGSEIPKLESAIYDGATKSSPKPVGLTIESLQIETSVVLPVGVEPNGEMEVPEAKEVGWYSFGSTPGTEGSTVLAAHIAESGVDGVFRHLADVEVGSVVEVALEDTTVAKYQITDLVEYKKTELPFDDIFKRSGSEQLVLITCGGDFNTSLRSYESNVVAYATPLA